MICHILLAGGGPRTEPWFLFLIPLLLILGSVKMVEWLSAYLKKRRLARENELVQQLTANCEEPQDESTH